MLIWLATALAAPQCAFVEQSAPEIRDDRDLPVAWLITVGPGLDPTNTFGHSALYVVDEFSSDVYDFGVYDITDDLVLDFIRQEQVYRGERWSLDEFLGHMEGRHIRAAPVQLPEASLRSLSRLVVAGTETGRNAFDYHWTLENCATKLRDAFDHATSGAVLEQSELSAPWSPRAQIFRHSAGVPALAIVPIMGGGRAAIEPLSWWDAMFLPDTLHEGLQRVTVDGRPILGEDCEIQDGPRVAPTEERKYGLLWSIGLLTAGVLGGALRLRPRLGGVLVATWAGGMGLFGTLALLTWWLGLFAPYWTLHNSWFTHPLTWAWVWVGWRLARGEPVHRGWVLVPGGLAVLGILYQLISGFADYNLDVIGVFLPPLIVGSGLLIWNPPGEAS